MSACALDGPPNVHPNYCMTIHCRTQILHEIHLRCHVMHIRHINFSMKTCLKSKLLHLHIQSIGWPVGEIPLFCISACSFWISLFLVCLICLYLFFGVFPTFARDSFQNETGFFDAIAPRITCNPYCFGPQQFRHYSLRLKNSDAYSASHEEHCQSMFDFLQYIGS